MLKRLIYVLACASTDPQHPGTRYGRLLAGLLRAFSKGQESAAPTRAPSPGVEASAAPQIAKATAEAPPAMDFTIPWSLGTAGAQATPQPGALPHELYPAFGGGFPSTFPPLSATPTAPQALSSTPFPMLVRA